MVRAYTRKDYIRKIPGSRIVQYDMGNLAGVFPLKVTLEVKEQAQLSHNALEAARIASNRYMQRKSGRMGYHLKIRGVPSSHSPGKILWPLVQELTGFRTV